MNYSMAMGYWALAFLLTPLFIIILLYLPLKYRALVVLVVVGALVYAATRPVADATAAWPRPNAMEVAAAAAALQAKSYPTDKDVYIDITKLDTSYETCHGLGYGILSVRYIPTDRTWAAAMRDYLQREQTSTLVHAGDIPLRVACDKLSLLGYFDMLAKGEN